MGKTVGNLKVWHLILIMVTVPVVFSFVMGLFNKPKEQ